MTVSTFMMYTSWQKLCMLQKLTIPHFKALLVEIWILEGQSLSIIRGTVVRPSLCKKCTFWEKGHGKSLTLPHPCPSLSLMLITRQINEVLWVFAPFVVFEWIKLKHKSLEFLQSYKVKSRKFTNSNLKLNFLKKYKWYKNPQYLIF